MVETHRHQGIKSKTRGSGEAHTHKKKTAARTWGKSHREDSWWKALEAFHRRMEDLDRKTAGSSVKL